MSHAQIVPNDGATAHRAPRLRGSGRHHGNGCLGHDWGWFDVGHVRFISRPEPEQGAYTDWQTKAAMGVVVRRRTRPSGIVTYGHRTACSSLKNGTAWSSDAKVVAAVASLGDRYSPSPRPTGSTCSTSATTSMAPRCAARRMASRN